MSSVKVKKRNGRLEDLDNRKIQKILAFASEGLSISPSQIEMNAHIQFYNGISTNDIHDMLTRSAADLIGIENPDTGEHPDYEIMAARLLNYQMRKQAYGEYHPPKLYDHVVKMIADNRYDAYIMRQYTREEIERVDMYIDHGRDDLIRFNGMNQIATKYAIRDREKGICLETPQFVFALISMYLHAEEDKERRMDMIKNTYDAFSLLRIALPTPVMAGVRTRTRQFSSCFLTETDDSLDSINATSNAIVKYVAARAGVGLDVSRIRGVDSLIRNGEATHTGIISFIRLFQAAVNSCNQGKLTLPSH